MQTSSPKQTPKDMENLMKWYNALTEITIKDSIRIIKGGKVKLTAKIKPPEATNVELLWTSSNEEIVTVDQYGNVEAKEIGKATITVKTADGEHTAECKVEVVEMVYEVKQEGEEIYIRDINPNTSKKEFKEKFPIQYDIEIYDETGRKIGEEEIIGTGYEMKIYEEDKVRAEGIMLGVKGDITGEGLSENVDLSHIIYHIIGRKELKGIYKEAGDINGDEEIDGRDIVNLIYHIINKSGFEWEN
jgi:hypothetical protein